jgi:hypothetical protein
MLSVLRKGCTAGTGGDHDKAQKLSEEALQAAAA